MLLADPICRFHSPPILLAVGGLCSPIDHSPPISIKKSLTFFFSISLNAFFSSKLLLLSLRIILIFPFLLMSLLSARIKLSYCHTVSI